MSKTEENLKEAFAGESQARNRYTFFASKAEEEKKPEVAKLFRAAALAEEIHARNHFEALGNLKSTEENLETGIQGENYEHSEMYPEFIEKAREEGDKQALKAFDFAKQVEEKHEEFYKEAEKAVMNDKDIGERDWHVCEVCGNTVKGDAPEKCPICGAPKEKFVEVE